MRKVNEFQFRATMFYSFMTDLSFKVKKQVRLMQLVFKSLSCFSTNSYLSLRVGNETLNSISSSHFCSRNFPVRFRHDEDRA